MGRLYLVRHAQAAFLSQNYDQLSALGEKQARLLGEYWAHRNVFFDRVCSGPAIRHRHTAQLVSEAYRKAGRDFPPPTIASEFNEFQGEAVLSESLPELLANNPKIRELHSALQCASDDVPKRASFQRLFESVISMWVGGGIRRPTAESWRDFCARVNRALSAFLVKSCKGESDAIFTSGGPISVAVKRALHPSAEDPLRLARTSPNRPPPPSLPSADPFTLTPSTPSPPPPPP